jgi:hypothetical protein
MRRQAGDAVGFQVLGVSKANGSRECAPDDGLEQRAVARDDMACQVVIVGQCAQRGRTV